MTRAIGQFGNRLKARADSIAQELAKEKQMEIRAKLGAAFPDAAIADDGEVSVRGRDVVRRWLSDPYLASQIKE